MEQTQNVQAQKTHPKKLVSSLYIFSWMAATSLCLSYFIYRNTSTFFSSDRPIHISHITLEKKKEFGGAPAVVRVGLTISEFRVFKMAQNEFVFDGVLWFKFDPSHISLATLGQFSFDRGEIIYQSKPTTFLQNGNLFARYDIQVKFLTPLSYREFPLDDHQIVIALTYKNLSPSDLTFVVRDGDFVLIPNMESVGWGEYEHFAEAGYLSVGYSETDPDQKLNYPSVLFTIDYGRQGNVRNSMIILFPMLLLFFISLFSLILDREKWFTTVISLPTQTIAGLVGYRFVMEAMSPTVGYFMYSDYFFFLFLALMFCVLLIHSVATHISVLVRQLIIAGFNGVIIAFSAYLLWS